MGIPIDVISFLIYISGLALNGIFIGVAAILVYFLKRRWERRELRRKLADTLGVELYEIANLLNPIDSNRAAIDPATIYPRIPTTTYDGLVSSGNVSNFDTVLQKQLYSFYRIGEENRLKIMRTEIIGTIAAVEDFRRRNSKRW